MDPLGFLNIYSVAKYQKNQNQKLKGDRLETLFFFSKSDNAELSGGPPSLARYCMLRLEKEQLL